MKVILILLATVNLVLCDQPFDDVLQLVGQAGYFGESHLAETEDGYILKVHRVLAKNGPSKRYPVFLMHGLIATSADYVMTGQKSALAYFLADNGYDVWMGNARGSKHSMNHRHLSTDSPEFWTFSWNEIGHYDVPAMIDLVLNKTGSPKTFYVGHSQGTTSFLVFMSTRPQYNEKIIQSHLFAPAGFMKHIPHPAIFTLSNYTNLNISMRKFRKISFSKRGEKRLLPRLQIRQLGNDLDLRQSAVEISLFDQTKIDIGCLRVINFRNRWSQQISKGTGLDDPERHHQSCFTTVSIHS